MHQQGFNKIHLLVLNKWDDNNQSNHQPYLLTNLLTKTNLATMKNAELLLLVSEQM